MSGAPIVPDNVDGQRVEVAQQTIRTVDCPNSSCNQTLNITELSAGAKIKCPNCQNYTWAPEYNPKWWQKTKNFVGTVVFSFVIGVGTSIVAPEVAEFIGRIKIVDSSQQQDPNKPMQPTTDN